MSLDAYVFFWNGPFSQWQRSEFVLDDVAFVTAEQAMMYLKAKLFQDDAVAEQILRTEGPGRQKALGRQVRGFQEGVWVQHREEIVTRITQAKYDQNKGLRRKLFQTAGKQLVEASPMDTVWGIGLDADRARDVPPEMWPGKNLLGQILTQVRDDLMARYPDEARQVARDIP